MFHMSIEGWLSTLYRFVLFDAMIFTTWVLSGCINAATTDSARCITWGLLHGSIFGVFADQLSTLASWFLRKSWFWNFLDLSWVHVKQTIHRSKKNRGFQWSGAVGAKWMCFWLFLYVFFWGEWDLLNSMTLGTLGARYMTTSVFQPGNSKFQPHSGRYSNLLRLYIFIDIPQL